MPRDRQTGLPANPSKSVSLSGGFEPVVVGEPAQGFSPAVCGPPIAENSVSRWCSVDAIDNHHLHRPFSSLDLQPELFLHGSQKIG